MTQIETNKIENFLKEIPANNGINISDHGENHLKIEERIDRGSHLGKSLFVFCGQEKRNTILDISAMAEYYEVEEIA